MIRNGSVGVFGSIKGQDPKVNMPDRENLEWHTDSKGVSWSVPKGHSKIIKLMETKPCKNYLKTCGECRLTHLYCIGSEKCEKCEPYNLDSLDNDYELMKQDILAFVAREGTEWYLPPRDRFLECGLRSVLAIYNSHGNRHRFHKETNIRPYLSARYRNFKKPE